MSVLAGDSNYREMHSHKPIKSLLIHVGAYNIHVMFIYKIRIYDIEFCRYYIHSPSQLDSSFLIHKRNDKENKNDGILCKA